MATAAPTTAGKQSSATCEPARPAAPTRRDRFVDHVLQMQRSVGNQAVLRSQSSCECGARLQPKLEISPGNDPLEHEADRLAAHVLRSPPAPVRVTPATGRLQRKCGPCEEAELRLQRKPAAHESSETGGTHGSVATVLGSSGRSLDAPTRAFFEPRLGQDLGAVRVHDDVAAASSTRAVGALAYTVGNDIAFGTGLYAPTTAAGRSLLAHELVHVVQQRGTPPGSRVQLLQRTMHGPSTPTNCDNPQIYLPAWLAGIYAHMQIAAWSGFLPHAIPHATKGGGLLIGVPAAPWMPWGFADLWQRLPGMVNVAEIKSTSIGGVTAAREARHYMDRHNQWMGRLAAQPLDRQDATYLAAVGGPLAGGLLDLSSRTGTGTAVGPFAADFAKTLWVEADALGALVYWCTGAGLPSPLWLPAIKFVIDQLRERLRDLKNQLQPIIEGAQEALVAAARALPAMARWALIVALVIALLACLVIAVACTLGIPVSLGTTSICTAASVGAAVAAAAAILILIGLPGGDQIGPTLASMQDLANPQTSGGTGYDDRDDTTAPASPGAVMNPTSRIASLLQPLAGDPLSIIRSITPDATLPDRARPALGQALAVLDLHDQDTAALIRATLRSSGSQAATTAPVPGPAGGERA